jgi:Na+-transporting methylmalonyl-CoA/oxaloacetate decarboxylase gamma subunit
MAFLTSNLSALRCFMQAIGEVADSLAGPAAEVDVDAADGDDGDEAAAAAAAAAPVGLVAVPRKVVKSKELLEYLDRPEVSA